MLDASKAFDKVERTRLWNKLFDHGVNHAIVFAIIAYYNASEMLVINGNDVSNRFKTSNGVRQGGILSPKLYNIYSEKLISIVKDLGVGILILSLIIGIIMYADDLTLIADNEVDLQKQIDVIGEQGELDDIKFNAKKSTIMIFNNYDKRNYDFKMYGSSIQNVKEARYLGYQLSTETDNLAHVLQRKKKAISQITKLNTLGLISKNLSPQSRAYLFKTYIRPVIMYGVDCCDLNENEMSIISKADGNALKNCIGINKQVRTKPIFDVLKVEESNFRILKDKINLFERLVENDLTRRVLFEFEKVFYYDSPSYEVKKYVSEHEDRELSLEGIVSLAKLKVQSVKNDIVARKAIDDESIAINDKLSRIFDFYKDSSFIFRIWACIGFSNKKNQGG